LVVQKGDVEVNGVGLSDTCLTVIRPVASNPSNVPRILPSPWSQLALPASIHCLALPVDRQKIGQCECILGQLDISAIPGSKKIEAPFRLICF
jgi:hypothetical protein